MTRSQGRRNRDSVAVSVDAVVFRARKERLEVLSIRRGAEPFSGRWALPGGFVQPTETLAAAAQRELAEETGLVLSYLEQLYTFGDPGRDPRGRIVSVAYFALVDDSGKEVAGGGDAAGARWFDVADPPVLAFDHAEILRVAVERLRAKVRYAPIGFHLLPVEFTLTDLQRLYETILGRRLDKRNFRRKLLGSGVVEATGGRREGVPYRAPRLYRFDRARYESLLADGFEWAI